MSAQSVVSNELFDGVGDGNFGLRLELMHFLGPLRDIPGAVLQDLSFMWRI